MDLVGKGILDKVNKQVLELDLKSGLWGDCMLVTFWKRGRNEVGAGLQSSPRFAPQSSCGHLEEAPLCDLHKVPGGLRGALLECI